MNQAPAIEITGVSHSYDPRPALREVSFAVGSGEIFARLGPNGGGKTPLFRILTTLLEPTAGQARVFGRDVVREPRAVRQRIGGGFQAPRLDRQPTVADNLSPPG